MMFMSFVILLVIGLVVAAILHYGLRLRIRTDVLSFAATVVWCYVGAWLGVHLFGTWFAGVAVAGVPVIPATLGAVAILIVAVDLVKTLNAGRA